MTRPVFHSVAASWRVCAAVLGLAVAACVLCAPARAAVPVRVFEVDLAERSGTALQDAMRVALVRATGRREAAEDPALSGIVADASRYVKNYIPGARGQSQVVFDGVALQQAITAAGRSVWDTDRPLTLVVLDPPRARAQAEGARAELERVAAARGLPISLVPMSLNDASGKPLGAQALLEATEHTGGDELLVGREGAAADAPLQWTLYGRGVSETWSGALAAGIDHTVDYLVPQQAGTATLAEAVARVTVDNVRTLADYAAVARLLAATPGVRHANILAADPGSVLFEVLVRGGGTGLEQALAPQGHLVRSGASGPRTQLRYQP